jgi:hypothetical protein
MSSRPVMVSANREGKRDGDDIQTCTGTAKWNEIDKVNAIVCSPSAKDERWRRMSSPELRGVAGVGED